MGMPPPHAFPEASDAHVVYLTTYLPTFLHTITTDTITCSSGGLRCTRCVPTYLATYLHTYNFYCHHHKYPSEELIGFHYADLAPCFKVLTLVSNSVHFLT